MKMAKKFLAVALAGVLALSVLTGCGDSVKSKDIADSLTKMGVKVEQDDGVDKTAKETLKAIEAIINSETNTGADKITLDNAVSKATGRVIIEVSPDFYRPTDVVNLWGDPSKAKRELGWNPTKTTFEQLVKIMVDHDMKKVAVERAEEHIKTNLAEYLEKGVIK